MEPDDASPLPLSDVLDAAFRSYRRHFLQFLGPVILFFIPVLTVQILGVTWFAASPLVVVMLGWMVTARLSAYPLIQLNAQGHYHQDRLPQVPPLWQTATSLRLIGAALLEVVILSVPWVCLFIYIRLTVPDNLDLVSENRMVRHVGVAFIITCLTMFWLGIHLQLTPPIIVREACGPLCAVRRSWTLTHGVWRRSCGMGVLLSMIYGIALIVLRLTLDSLPCVVGQWITQYTRYDFIPIFLLQSGALLLIPLHQIVTTLFYDQRCAQQTAREKAESLPEEPCEGVGS
ncbi:MAG: hypothetical protein MI924_39485 [Chloroflexales bacterium]|nr:hypothetical protein [Chloroflexales bacterium]